MSIYEDDLKNRFPTYTFTETTIQDLQIVTVLDGATTLHIARASTLDECYQNLRLKMVGGGEILLSITSAQRDALPSQPDGTNIFNTDESAVQVGVDDAFANVGVETVVSTVQTTDNTTTVIATIGITDDTVNVLHVHVNGIKDDGTDRATYMATQSVYRTGGGVAVLLGSTTEDHSAESDASWGGVTFSVLVNNILVEVDGKNGTTIDWNCIAEIKTFAV